MNRFKIEVSECENQPGKVDAIVDVQCDAQFLAANLGRAIVEITKTVDSTAPDLFECKNGFWLVVCDIVNAHFQKEAGVEND